MPKHELQRESAEIWTPTRKKRFEAVRKPGSVVSPRRADGHLSRTPVARRLERPTRESVTSRTGSHPPKRIAPCLVLLRVGFTEPAGSPRLLVRSYRTVSPLPDPGAPCGRAEPSAVCSLWHFPWPRGRSALPTTLSCGARTFLSPTNPGQGQPASDHPNRFEAALFYGKPERRLVPCSLCRNSARVYSSTCAGFCCVAAAGL
jgi:hypothetical protein